MTTILILFAIIATCWLLLTLLGFLYFCLISGLILFGIYGCLRWANRLGPPSTGDPH